MSTPWYNYNLDSPGGGYQEMIDPMGNYLKPDTNIAVPAGTPITSWDSGTSPTWGNQCPQCNSKQPNLDPRIILNALRSGSGLPVGASASGGGSGLSGLPFGIGGAIGAVETTVTNLSEEIGVFIIALAIIALGVFLLAQRQIEGAAKTGIKAGVKAGEVAAL